MSFVNVCIVIVVCVCVVGEVPGLYSTEELEPLLSSLKDQASQDGFTAPVLNYFSHCEYTLKQCTHTYVFFYSCDFCVISLCACV